MKQVERKILLWSGVALCAAAGLLLDSPVASPASGTFGVTLETFEEITLTEVRILDFGRIIAPTGSTQTFTVHPDGSTSTSSGTGHFLSGQQGGVVYVAGSDGEFFTIDGTPGSCTGFSGIVTFTEVAVSPTLGTLDQPVQVGGTLEVDSAAQGQGTCAYNVSADYQ